MHRVAVAFGIATFFLAAIPGFVSVWASPPADSSRSALGKCVSDSGTLLRFEGKKGWQALRRGDPVFGGDQLLTLPGQRGEVDSSGGKIRLVLWGNLPEQSSPPVLESAVTLRPGAEADLDFSLDRGRVLVANQKDKETARLQVHFPEHSWGLNLDGSSIAALEFYQRWPRGAPFSLKPGPEDAPGTAMILWVLKGEAALRVSGEQYSLHAPPGPAYFRWDNLSGADAGPKRRDELPSWAERALQQKLTDQPSTPALAEQRRRLAQGSAHTVLAENFDRSDPAARRLAIYGLAALDDLARPVQALADPKSPEVREAAFEALRHRIGRGAGQDLALYHFLTNRHQYTPSQAEIILQFLHGFSDRERTQPETYETMIAYLQSSKLAIRQLAKRQLDQWVPDGKAIAYDPAGPESDRRHAYEEWKKLVPPGRLPSKPTADEKKK
jgi:hypothetical protein